MAKIRGIKPEFWTDDAVVELSIPARLLFIGMWNFACDNGHLDDKPKQLKMRIFPADDVDLSEMLDELEDQKRITRKGGTITIPKFSSHQKPHKRWWTTCDLPWCKVPEDASSSPTSAPTTVAPQVDNGCATADVTDVTDGDGDGEGDKAQTRRASRRPLPPDWKPTAKHHEYGDEHWIDVPTQAMKFRNNALSKDLRYVDWDAAFRNWLVKALEYGQTSKPKPNDRSHLPEAWR